MTNKKCEMCKNKAVWYRDLDSNPRPLCNEHYRIIAKRQGLMFTRHYIKI